MAERQKVRGISEQAKRTEEFGPSLADAPLVKCPRCGAEIDHTRCRKCGYQPSARILVGFYFLLVLLPAASLLYDVSKELGNPSQGESGFAMRVAIAVSILVGMWCVVLWRRGRR